MPRKDSANTPASAQAQQEAVSEGIENFELPRALVTRIAKSAVCVLIPVVVPFARTPGNLKDLQFVGPRQCEAAEGHGSLPGQGRVGVY